MKTIDRMFFISLMVFVSVMTGSVAQAANFPGEKGFTREDIEKVTVVAHRGGASLGPENTLATIGRGIAAGAEMVEIDIHQTQDGELVVCHDESVDRTTNGKGLIRDMKIDEIRAVNIIDNDGNVTGERIPTLDEVLAYIDGRARLLIEIKRGDKDIYQGIEQRMVDAIDKCNARNWTVAQSFDDSVLETLHDICPALRLEKLCGSDFKGLERTDDGILSEKDYEKYTYVESFNIYYGAVTDRLIKDLHDHGREIKIWTVGAPAETPYMNVDGIITDYPQKWR